MSYPVTNNCQAALTVNPGQSADIIPTGRQRSITNPIAAVELQGNRYGRVGGWVIRPETTLVATFNQNTNHVYLTTPDGSEVVYVQ